MSAPFECPCCGRIDVAGWLRGKGVNLRYGDAAIIEHILTETPCSVTEVGVPESSLRFRFRKKGLPPAGKWIQLASAIGVARAIQADADESVMRIAFKFGYSDHSAVAHLLRRNLAVTPSELREGPPLDLGAVLDEWWERQQSTRRRQGAA